MTSADHADPARLRVLALLIALVIAATLLVWIATGALVMALLPLGLVLLGWAAFRAPAHALGLGLFFLAIVLDNPKEHPAQGDWQSPLYPLGLAFYENLNSLTGIAPLRFSVMDVVLALGLVLLALRGSARRAEVVPLPRPLHAVLAVFLVTLLALEVYGLGRGGDFANSLWQLRQLMWVPGITWIFAATIRGPRDLRAISAAVVVAAVVKVACGAYFYWIICGARNLKPDYVNTHSDTVLYTTALVIVVAAWLERPSSRRALAAVATIAVVGVGVIINGRRLAYIGVAGSLFAMYLLLPKGSLRSRLHRTLGWAALPGAAYLRLGWHSQARIFGPAQKIASLFSDTDRSAGSRDIENYNLIVAWKKNLLFGTGFGHAYDELSKADSIERFFALYRYIGHDSVLWFFNVGGVVGFTAVWSTFVVGAYFAARAHTVATAPDERAAALVCLCVVVSFIVQAYGDMGMQSFIGVFILGMALAVAGKLAVSVRAWPLPSGALARSPELSRATA